MNTFIKILEIIINSNSTNNRFIYEYTEIRQELLLLVNYGSYYDKQEFSRLMINEINNSISLAYLFSRFPMLWMTTDFIELTTHIENTLRYVDPNNTKTLFSNSKYRIDSILLDNDSNIYFNIMGIISMNIPLQEKLRAYEIFFNEISDISKESLVYSNIFYGMNPGDSIFLYFINSNHLVSSVKKFMDSMFIFAYFDLIMDICLKFAYHVSSNASNRQSLYLFITDYINELNYTKPEAFNDLVDIVYPYTKSYEETPEFNVLFYLLVNIYMDCFVEIAMFIRDDPNLALFFIKNRFLLGYFQ